MKTADFKLPSYATSRDKRATSIVRHDMWRRAAEPKHAYGHDGGGRHRVRVIAPNPSREDLMGGALRDAFPVHESKAWKDATYARNVHNGWYTDPDGVTSRDGTGLCWGMVAYLGHGRWLAGYTLGGTDCGAYHLDEFYDNELDAARAADSLAQHVAEKEQEYQQRWQDARALEDDIDDKSVRLRELLALRHKRCMEYVRDEIAETVEAIRETRAILATEYKGVL